MLAALTAGKSPFAGGFATRRHSVCMARRLLGRKADELTSCRIPMETNGGNED